MVSITRKLSLVMIVAGFAMALLPPALPMAVASERHDGAGEPAIAAKDPEGAELPSWGKKKKKEDEKPPAAPGATGVRKPEEPAYDEVVKDFDKIDGLFTV